MTRAADVLVDDDGSTLVEFGVVAAIFLLMIFALVDFGRLGFSYVLAEKATQRAVRVASVRPPICTGLPTIHARRLFGALGQTVANGTACTAVAGLCEAPATVRCLGSEANPTARAIWAEVRPLLPVNAEISHLRFSYSYDPALASLGTRYAPVITVDLADLDFAFVTPIGALASLAGAGPSDLGESFVFPPMSSSLPAEDLR